MMCDNDITNNVIKTERVAPAYGPNLKVKSVMKTLKFLYEVPGCT